MGAIQYYSTNDKSLRVSFSDALLRGMPDDNGLYMFARKDTPKLKPGQINDMRDMSYSQIAFQVLNPFLRDEIARDPLESILSEAYDLTKIPTEIDQVVDNTYMMWLTQGPTYSFKDYAARFYGRMLNHFLGERGLKRTVVVATSGDTGGAIADCLYGLENVDIVVLYPHGAVSNGQRRQMTTLQNNVYAFEIQGDFDVCQELAKNILVDNQLAESLGDPNKFTSANSISVGRLLPQSVYPFFAYSRMDHAENEKMLTSIPSGNLGDMMGTLIAKEMGLPVDKILCGVNENKVFHRFLKHGIYDVKPSVFSPSSAMIVSHPSNLVRLIDFYGGHMFDERGGLGKVIKQGRMGKRPNHKAMTTDIVSYSVNNPQHFRTIHDVYEMYKIIIDPHTAVAWNALEVLRTDPHSLALVYATADPGKFPEDVKKAIGIIPKLPKRMQEQSKFQERIFTIQSKPDQSESGKILSQAQKNEFRQVLADLHI